MDRITLPERPEWRAKAEELGFTFASMHGEPYWDETSAYRFTLAELENRIEDPATELHAMTREAVAAIVADEALMAKMGIPQEHWDFVANSWNEGAPELYGRMDLAYDGKGPAKLLEYNADTPTSLYESSGFQWLWFEDQVEAGVLSAEADQFNRIHEALVERFAELMPKDFDLHFAAMSDNVEDYATVETLAWAAREAGLGAHFTDMAQIGLTEEGQFADSEGRVIGALFKLYPWEDMLREPFSANLAGAGCHFLEPAWKALVSNKGILPVLWKLFPNHPNLLPSFFEDDVAGLANAAALMLQGHVTKPLFSREGASVTITQAGRILAEAKSRDYDAYPKIIQAYQPLPAFDGQHPVLGAWIVGQTCVGMGVREDKALITQDLSRFKPHFIEG